MTAWRLIKRAVASGKTARSSSDILLRIRVSIRPPNADHVQTPDGPPRDLADNDHTLTADTAEPWPKAATEEVLVGRTLGEFVLREQVGRGGFGAVFRATQSALDREAVVKVLHPWLRTSKRVTDRFLREARLASKLDHPYAAHVYASGAEPDGALWIAMELVRGTSLDKVLEIQGTLALERFVPLFDRICEVVHTAHEHGIVHRDLKPANIFVTPSEDDPWEIRVIDFGIAKQMHAGPSTAFRGPLGTLLFMAVEQFERPSEATPLSDVYALAVVVYLMVTGRYPWGEHHSAFELYRRQQSERPDPAPTMPPGWEDTVFSALSPDPQQRPRSMHEFVYPLAVALAASPPYNSGLEILRGVARRWASSSPNDETLRGTATTGAWRAASSGAWPAATSGAWPVGSWPGAVSGSWPAAAVSEPSSATLPTPSAAASGRRMPAAWKLALLATAAAVLAGLVVFVMVMAVRALEGR
jgi:serine/threonine-protein kinase